MSVLTNVILFYNFEPMVSLTLSASIVLYQLRWDLLAEMANINFKVNPKGLRRWSQSVAICLLCVWLHLITSLSSWFVILSQLSPSRSLASLSRSDVRRQVWLVNKKQRREDMRDNHAEWKLLCVCLAKQHTIRAVCHIPRLMSTNQHAPLLAIKPGWC